MSRPQLALVSDAPPRPVPTIDTISATLTRGNSEGTVRLSLVFTPDWIGLLPARAEAVGTLEDGLLLKPTDRTDRRQGVYTGVVSPEERTTRFQLHARYVGRDLRAGCTVQLLEASVGPRGITVRAVPQNGLGPSDRLRLSLASSQRRANPQGSLPLDVPPAGNLIEQLRIALGNLNAIAADIPGLTLRLEDGRVKAGVDL